MPISQIVTNSIANGAVVAADLADGSVTTDKINNSAVTPAKLSQPLTLGTSISSTSGTSIDFTGIPSWVKRVTVMLNAVSANAFGRHIIQLGTGGTPATSGYTTNYMWISTNNSTVRSNGGLTSGFPFFADEAGDVTTGVAVFTLLTGNNWIGIGGSLTTGPNAGAGNSFSSVTLSGALNMIRVTTTAGTPTFDQGTINILYE